MTLWIRNPDDRGNVVDQRLIESAHQVWPRARNIVVGILGSAEDAPRIVEIAVHQASRALERNGPVATPEQTEAGGGQGKTAGPPRRIACPTSQTAGGPLLLRPGGALQLRP